MDNLKKQGAIAQYPNNQFGFSVRTRHIALGSEAPFTDEKIVAISELDSLSSPLKHKNQRTQWIYEGAHIPRENGTITFLVDHSNVQLAIEIKGKKIILKPDNHYESITLTDLKKNQPISIKLTATTDGDIPSFRFLWDTHGDIHHVPDHAVTPAFASSDRINKTNTKIWEGENTLTPEQQMLVADIKNNHLKLGHYRGKGRIVIIGSDSRYLNTLKSDPNYSLGSKASFELFNWLMDKPRFVGETNQHFVLSTLPVTQFSGFGFHSNQNLFIDSFNSPHEWRDGEPRAQNQIVDLLLPSGQWHRHYDTVVISESANDKQVELVRHWLELTGGSLLIIQDKQKTMPPHMQRFVNDIHFIDTIGTTEPDWDTYGIQQSITLPAPAINSLKLTNILLGNTQYFSIIINDKYNKPILSLHDIQLDTSSSWQAFAHQIETKVNTDLALHHLAPIKIEYKNNTLNFYGENYVFSQFQLKKMMLGHEKKILPILVAENPNAEPNQLTVGAITGRLPESKHIQKYQILEQPKFGKVIFNQETKQWQYHANDAVFKTNSDQFDLVAIMHDGRISAPISIQLQTDMAPQISIPGKRTFSMKDPIYHEPAYRNYATPDDLQGHHIQLAQTHLQERGNQYISLTANRWALLKLDITSLSSAKSPNVVAIVKNKEGQKLGEVRLTGPDKLPTELTAGSNIPNVLAHDFHQNSFTAPLKGEWIQPGIEIVVLVNNKPIVMKGTNQPSTFSPNVTLDSHITAHINSSSLYQQGHGIYAYSPLSWGLEAAAKLPVKQFTLYSYPTTVQQPSLHPYTESSAYHSTLIHPKYDDPQKIDYHPDSQIRWAPLNNRRNNKDPGYYYAAIEPLIPSNMNNNTLGFASHHSGGGVNEPTTMWHEIFGHGFGLPHTTELSDNGAQIYPFDASSHGSSYGYDQYRQHYMTYQYTSSNGDTAQIYPTMYPIMAYFTSNEYDAFLPHSDYYNAEIHKFLRTKIRWQPNKIKGKDNEDGGFAGEGFYQQWDKDNKNWVTLNSNNFLDYYTQRQIDQLPHQRDVPIYWIRGQYLEMGDGQPHPYNTITVDRTIGDLPADYHNLDTGTGTRFYIYNSYALTVTYATSEGLLTETLQVQANPNSMNLNIADKGELVKFTIHTLSSQKEFGKAIYQYTNPNALANRVFANSDGKSAPNTLILDHYWQGSKIFWAATDAALIDFSTGKIKVNKITPQSMLCARWVESGKLHQQYFSLSDPFGKQGLLDTDAKWAPINHLNAQANPRHTPSTDINQPSNQLFLSDVHVSQQVDIRRLSLPAGNYTYWAVLIVEDENGNRQEKAPIEPWYLSGDSKTLQIKGTIDSTPDLNLAGIKIYIDKHLHDDVSPSSIWVHQNTARQLVENKEFLNYDRPVVFNSIVSQPEIFSSFSEEKHELPLVHSSLQNISASALNTPLITI